MVDIDQDSMERLASMLAMLASESGEADNAGRAVGMLARRLGLTGGDLKQIFLRGIEGGPAPADVPLPRAEAARVARENVTLRHSLDAAEAAVRALTHDLDTLRLQNETLVAALDRRRAGGPAGLILGVAFLAAVMIGALVMFLGPSFRTAEEVGTIAANPSVHSSGGAAAPGTSAGRLAHVRARGAPLRDIPDTSSPVIATLPAGTHVGVRRLFWNALVQWAEVDVDGRSEYLVTTDVDLP